MFYFCSLYDLSISLLWISVFGDISNIEFTFAIWKLFSDSKDFLETLSSMILQAFLMIYYIRLFFSTITTMCHLLWWPLHEKRKIQIKVYFSPICDLPVIAFRPCHTHIISYLFFFVVFFPFVQLFLCMHNALRYFVILRTLFFFFCRYLLWKKMSVTICKLRASVLINVTMSANFSVQGIPSL